MTVPDTTNQGSARMVLVMGAVGLIASILLVATYVVTKPYIDANKAAQLEQAVFDVLPGASRQTVFLETNAGELVPLDDEARPGRRLYAGYDADGRLVGVAVEAAGQGFQDVLRLLYGYMPACGCVVGMQVLESKETPGLGDKIETDPAFRANFDSLDVRLADDGETRLHDVTLVKRGAAREPWQITAITGATISSKAVTEIIDRSTAEVLPVVRRNLDALERGGTAAASPPVPPPPAEEPRTHG